jgi:hypothetical protein
MPPVTVLILLPPRSGLPGSPLSWLEDARQLIAERHRAAFAALGAAAWIVSGPDDGRMFGRRLRDAALEVTDAGRHRRGIVVLGGGSLPLATAEDLGALLAAAGSRESGALANNRYSADAIAVSDARVLLDLPDLPADNALPRWLAEHAGVPVADLAERTTLAFDIDSPLDVLLLARTRDCPPELATLAARIAADSPVVCRALDDVAATVRDPRAEVVLAGRTSARTVARLERDAACRVRVLIEERGLRASTAVAQAGAADPSRAIRPPRSVLGMALDSRGPGALGAILSELGDAALIDTRVLLAHRLGADDRHWPSAGDRLASDLLRSSDIADQWLRDLTASAAGASIPIVLGGHTLVGPGAPLLAGPAVALVAASDTAAGR